MPGILERSKLAAVRQCDRLIEMSRPVGHNVSQYTFDTTALVKTALSDRSFVDPLEIRRPFLGLKMDGIGASNELHAEPGPN